MSFEKTTLDDIAKEVGLNKASLCYYYKNKEEIFLEVTTNATRRFVETLQSSALEKTGDDAAKIGHYLVERSVYFVQLVAQVHISEETLRQVEPLFQDLMRDVSAQEIGFLSQILDDAVTGGDLRATEARRLAANLIDLSEAIKERSKAQAHDRRDKAAIASDNHKNVSFMLGIVFAGLAGAN